MALILGHLALPEARIDGRTSGNIFAIRLKGDYECKNNNQISSSVIVPDRVIDWSSKGPK